MLKNLQALPADPILGLITAFAKDTNPDKIDLGVGIYQDESSATPVMAAVKDAEAHILTNENSKSYLPPAGDAVFNQSIQALILGSDHQVLTDQRTCSIQAPGGTGALRIGAETVHRSNANARIWLSDPTWANHTPVMESAGLNVAKYPYYDATGHRIDFDAMLQALRQAGADDVVLIHGCCHNPSGADLSQEQWHELTALALQNGFTPYIDVAYQGLGAGLDEDAAGLRWMASQVPEMLIASSCSKNFGLYRERVGALVLITESQAQADIAKSQALNAARQNYSMPPSHGAQTVGLILNDPSLRKNWQQELNTMRNRLTSVRKSVAERLSDNNKGLDFSFIANEQGMFSFLGISLEQVKRLRSKYGIYMADSTRINIAGLNRQNMDYFVNAVCSVL